MIEGIFQSLVTATHLCSLLVQIKNNEWGAIWRSDRRCNSFYRTGGFKQFASIVWIAALWSVCWVCRLSPTPHDKTIQMVKLQTSQIQPTDGSLLKKVLKCSGGWLGRGNWLWVHKWRFCRKGKWELFLAIAISDVSSTLSEEMEKPYLHMICGGQHVSNEASVGEEWAGS